ncbi:MAG: SLC13 family permease [Eggerthellaceae bacterium]|nr:SLC13 family permease [Eggerthellaceae bacterium]
MPKRVIASAVGFIRANTVLAVSFVCAAVTVAFVPPDAQYAGYFDWKTLACLFSILTLVEALRNAGAFQSAARSFVRRFHGCRSTILALVASTAVISMFATNDMALVMMLPLSAITLGVAGWENRLRFTFIMQGLAANLGGMIMPFGNPQNLYLFEYFGFGLGEFLATMALPFAASMLLVFVCVMVKLPHGVKPRPAKGAQRTRRSADVLARERDSLPFHVNLAPKKRIAVYLVLLALVLAAVFRILPFWLPLMCVLVGLLLLDDRALKAADFGLLLTFVCFFVFAGNMARIPAIEALLTGMMERSTLLTSVAFSQVISNVPAAILLAQFCQSPHALLIGVNVGGAGTLVASLASLITFGQFRRARSESSGMSAKDRSTMGFLRSFMLYNILFLAVLVLICLPFT